MGSEGNQMNAGTSFQPSETSLCANGCGFFGTAATMNLCSKCYRDFRLREEQATAAKVALEKFVGHNQVDDVDLGSLEYSSSVVAKASSSASAVESLQEAAETAAVNSGSGNKGSNRCLSCKKKVGVMGFTCKCGCTFCGVHRYPEKHDCTFDFKGQGRHAIAKSNPVVKADKIRRI